MGSQAISGLAALVVLAFIAMAVTACANSDTQAEAIPTEEVAGVPEFHGASIGADTLRSRLESES